MNKNMNANIDAKITFGKGMLFNDIIKIYV